MGSPGVERFSMTLPDGRRLVLERNYVYVFDQLEPVGVDPESARAWVDGWPVDVDDALALIRQVKDDADRRAHG